MVVSNITRKPSFGAELNLIDGNARRAQSLLDRVCSQRLRDSDNYFSARSPHPVQPTRVALTSASMLFFASPNNIRLFSRKKSGFSTPA